MNADYLRQFWVQQQMTYRYWKLERCIVGFLEFVLHDTLLVKDACVVLEGRICFIEYRANTLGFESERCQHSPFIIISIIHNEVMVESVQ